MARSSGLLAISAPASAVTSPVLTSATTPTRPLPKIFENAFRRIIPDIDRPAGEFERRAQKSANVRSPTRHLHDV
jgi:hypothetical protein